MSWGQTSKVKFFFNEPFPALRNREKLKSFIVHIFKREGIKLNSLNYIFTNDKEVLQINKKYLNHDYFTDIITFELNSIDEPVTADVFISSERIRDNVKKYKSTINNEAHRIIFHGALHLCGYKDNLKNQKAQMKSKEDFYLNKYVTYSFT
jgi:rRNA maturation RNase YbeY